MHGDLARPEHFLLPEAGLHSEVAGAMLPGNWVEKDPAGGFTTYPKRDQGVKVDCTCYGAAKSLSIDALQEMGLYRELSPDMAYPYVVQPGGGASSLDAMNFVAANGMGVDALYPSDALSEAEGESAAALPSDNKKIGMLYAPAAIVQSASDFETIASIIETFRSQGIRKAVTVTIIGQNNGTWYSATPSVPSPSNQNPNWYHRVTVTDYGLINGEKVLAIDNSWGTAVGNGGQQFLAQGWEPYMFGAIYTVSRADAQLPATPPAKPTHSWSAALGPGSTGPDVLALQQALQSLGMFPASSVLAPTGNYGGITKSAVTTYQASFALPQTGLVDPATMASLNALFGPVQPS